MRNIAALGLIAVLLLSSCTKKFDDKGRLLVNYLESSTGEIKFSPMVRSSGPALDEDVIVYSYKKEPYTGPIANYDKNGKLLMEGRLKNGLADSTFTFYFNSGGVQMKGNYVAGKDLGLWQSFYGYDKVKIEKLYNDKGYLIERKEYYSNGQLKNYQKIRVKTELTEDGRSSEITADNKIAHSYDDKERIVSYDRRGNLESIYVEDSIKWEKGQ